MRIGIVTPAVMFVDFLDFFDKDSQVRMMKLSNNNNVPAPSLIAKGLVHEGHFVRLFTIGSKNTVFSSERVEIIICKINIIHSILCPFSELNKTLALMTAIKSHCNDLDVLHSHWTYHTALATVPFARKIKTFSTVRDWAPTIISYLPDTYQKRDIYYNSIINRIPSSLQCLFFIRVLVKILSYCLACKPNFLWISKLRINNYILTQKNITFIANSPYTKALIEQKIKKETPCIMNMIDDAYLLKTPPKRIHTYRIITIQSMLDSRKNIGRLIEALQIVKRTFNDVRLSFLYSFPLETLYLYDEFKMWKEKGWLDVVDIYCNVPHNEIYKYIDESAMLVHPSLEESFGNTIVEGMMRRTPIIGGKQSGAVPYLLDFGERGFICDVSSSNEIANTIIKVFEEYDNALRIADNAFEWVENHNTPKAIIAQHIKCFTD